MRRNDAKLIERLAAGETVTCAAKLTGVSRRTVSRRLADPEFRRMIGEARRRIVDTAAGRLAISMTAAAATLRKLLKTADSDAVRLQAAKAIVELAVRLRDATELEERITILETALAGRAN